MAKRFWQGPMVEQKDAIARHKTLALQGVMTIARQYQAKMERYAKQNRVWTDRTANARQGLHSYIEGDPTKNIRLYLSHGVNYGEDLEMVSHGAFAIIEPTLDYHAPAIIEDIRIFFKRGK